MIGSVCQYRDLSIYINHYHKWADSIIIQHKYILHTDTDTDTDKDLF